jgi:hypothetical protein
VDRGGVYLQVAAGNAGIGGNGDAAVDLPTGVRVGVERAAANTGIRIGARVAAAIAASVELGQPRYPGAYSHCGACGLPDTSACTGRRAFFYTRPITRARNTSVATRE